MQAHVEATCVSVEKQDLKLQKKKKMQRALRKDQQESSSDLLQGEEKKYLRNKEWPCIGQNEAGATSPPAATFHGNGTNE